MRFLLLALLCVIAGSVCGQDYATQRSVSGKVLYWYDEAFRQASVNNFAEAEKNLRKALDKEPTFLDARFLLGNVLYEAERYLAAEAEYEYILRTAPTYNMRVYYNLAVTEKKAEKYTEASAHFTDFVHTDPDEKMRAKAVKERKSADFLAYATANPVPFFPENLGTNINTSAHEYLPAFTADGETLIFTRNNRQEDFYAAKAAADGNWQSPEPLTDINTEENEGAQTVTADGKLLIFTACNRKGNIGRCDLYYSVRENGVYSEPALMPEGINTKHWESQPSLTPNGDVLYFASDRPESLGRSDIFVSYRINGKWTNPRNLGASINTPEDEVAPFIHADGQTLYFTSEGHPGMGKKDLFYARWNAEKRDWNEPVNLGVPINTKGEEGTLVISTDGKTAYFAGNRPDDPAAQGGTDLYKFALYEEAQPQKVTYVKAVVTDAVTGQPLQSRVEITNLTKNLPYVTAETGEDGTFLIVMGIGKDYGLSVNKAGYLFYSDNFALEKAPADDKPFLLEIALTPVPDIADKIPVTKEPVILKNIFFESGKADLLPVSLTELNRLKELLTENPDLRIQINGHTDNVGSDADNLTLSTDRAESVYNWLIEQEIAADRLEYKGYGETRPIADNETEAGRRSNRRTEFIIL